MNNDNAKIIEKEADEATVTTEELSTFKSIQPNLPRGRQAGYEHLRPINIEEHIIKYECVAMMLEHQWIRQLKLVINPYMYRSLGRANYKTNTAELSDKLFKEPLNIQREVFIRTISHFIASKLFSETGTGQAFKLIVQRYMKKPKGQSNSTGNVIVTETESA